MQILNLNTMERISGEEPLLIKCLSKTKKLISRMLMKRECSVEKAVTSQVLILQHGLESSIKPRLKSIKI